MELNQTPEQIIASAMMLPVDQRRLVAQQLLNSLSAEPQLSNPSLAAVLKERIDEVERGELSKLTFSDIKQSARADS